LPSLRQVGFSWPDGTLLADGLDLDVAEGAITALVGSSGCGKSTVLRLLAGLLSPQSGTMDRPEGELGFVFQSPTLLPWRTVAENIALPEELGGVVGMSITEALHMVEMADHANKLPSQLSGGQQMRVSLARALRGQPALLLLDEPFAALDALTRKRLQQHFAQLQATHRLTVVLVTHDLDEAVLLADRVLVLQGPPTRVAHAVDIDLPRPRTVHDPAVGAVVRGLEEAL
jgi:ABC-type nitrate/sulfonate/bicarbonate transport system ATPase subunit